MSFPTSVVSDNGTRYAFHGVTAVGTGMYDGPDGLEFTLEEARRFSGDCPKCGGRTYVAGGWFLTCAQTACLTPVRQLHR